MAFYRIDDIENYPDAAKFFRLINQLYAYRGAVREEATRQSAEADSKQSIERQVRKHQQKRVTEEGKQRELLHNNDAEMAQVKTAKTSYLQERLKQAR